MKNEKVDRIYGRLEKAILEEENNNRLKAGSWTISNT